MAQVQQIYAHLFTHIDAATSLLLKQDLVDAEFVREQNQRIFTKLNAIQDAVLMRSSSQEAARHEPDLDVTGPSVRHNLDHSAGSGPHTHSVPNQGDIGDKETRDHGVFYSIHRPADYLNYRQTT